ncbi:MAG: hypothetical protein K5787_18985 [Lentisphaeria bacterium]|nr:hypothetical protein [Lentisphaeria bacterium]
MAKKIGRLTAASFLGARPAAAWSLRKFRPCPPDGDALRAGTWSELARLKAAAGFPAVKKIPH